jgi:hypothetical protein
VPRAGERAGQEVVDEQHIGTTQCLGEPGCLGVPNLGSIGHPGQEICVGHTATVQDGDNGALFHIDTVRSHRMIVNNPIVFGGIAG